MPDFRIETIKMNDILYIKVVDLISGLKQNPFVNGDSLVDSLTEILIKSQDPNYGSANQTRYTKVE